MVKHSLMNLLDKYPYFLDKRSVSNLYKVTDVNNSLFKDLYNNLFQVYQSFHLNKRLLIWKTQTEPYVYQIHFCCTYPNIKSVKIYKNNTLIHKETFLEDVKKNDYNWTYECDYIKTNMLPVVIYMCVNCGEIYIGDALPRTCNECGEILYTTIRMYECADCGEIYFVNPDDEGDINIVCDNGCNSTFNEVYIYKCTGKSITSNEGDCGELYIGSNPPDKCSVCGVDRYVENARGDLFYDDDSILILDNSVNYDTGTEVIVDEDGSIIDAESNLTNDEDIDEITGIEGEENVLKLPISIIPDDTFKFQVETWDEYSIIKGFPENDEVLDDEFDHDYSLDAIGALNNIPRKNYISIDDEDLYFLTEPPYNKSLTEDDYHYMKRMVLYNIRLWVSLYILNSDDENYLNYLDFLNQIGISEEDYLKYKNNTKLFVEYYNPITLELWKNYGIGSRLVNREKLLLKLFDLRKHNKSYVPYKVDSDNNPIIKNGSKVYKDEWEVVTDLAECWVPQQWEHKDKFCDATQLSGEYFFVIASTLRPVPYENVKFDFILMNGLAELLNDDYYVNVSYYYGDKSKKIVIDDVVTEDFFRFPYEYLNGKNTNVLFEAIRSDGEYIGSCEVILTPRNCTNADIYVDAGSTKSKQDGSLAYPYKDLQKALDKVSNNLNVIALKSNIVTNKPYSVSNDCKIIGCNVSENATQISNTGSKFFKIIGGKNCSLTLSNLKLKAGNLSAFISNATWVNSNNYIDYYSSVIISGGWVNITIISPLEENSFFPTDIVKIKAVMKDKDGVVIPNLPIKIFFDGEDMGVVNTNSYGELEYDLSINKIDNGEYDLDLLVFSETYFSVSETIKINCNKTPKSYNGEVANDVVIVSEGYNNIIGKTIKVFVDGIEVDTVVVDSNGKINYTYEAQWGVHVITFVDEDNIVLDMITITSILTMSKIIGKKFIKNFNVNNTNGNVEYTLLTVNDNHKVTDLNGVLLNLSMDSGSLVYDVFNIESSHENLNEILYEEALLLENAVTDIKFEDSYIISYDVLGEFWE